MKNNAKDRVQDISDLGKGAISAEQLTESIREVSRRLAGTAPDSDPPEKAWEDIKLSMTGSITLDEEFIRKGNKAIEQFLGIGHFDDSLNRMFDKDWGMLMPVYRLAKDYLHSTSPNPNYVNHGHVLEVDVHCAIISVDITLAYKTLVILVDWINLQKSKS